MTFYLLQAGKFDIVPLLRNFGAGLGLLGLVGLPMDLSPIRQTFELGKFISTAGKSILNVVKL